MASNIAVKITADQTQLETQLAIARANTNQFTSELNKLARQLAQTGAATPELTGKMQELAAKSLAAKSRVAELKDTLGQTRAGFGQFGAGLNIVRDAFGALGVVASAGAVVSFGKNLATSIADLGEQSQQIGVGVEALQAYRAALEENGIALGDTDALLTKLTRNIGEAVASAGKQRDAFKELGIGARELANGTEGALPKVAQALLRIKDPAQRARLEVDLFGKSGQKLESALEVLATPTASLIEKYKALGIVLGKDVSDAADKAIDGMNRNFRQLAVSVAPQVITVTVALAKIVDGFTKAAKAMDDFKYKWNSWSAIGGAIRGDFSEANRRAFRGMGPVATNPDPKKIDKYFPKDNAPTGFAPTPEELEKQAARERQIAAIKIQTWEQSAQRHVQVEQQTNNHLLAMGAVTLDQFKAREIELEDERFRIAREGADRRLKADKGDPVAYARDLAQKETLAQEHADRMLAIDQKYAERKRQRQQSELQDFLAESSARLNEMTDELDQAYAMGEIGAQRRHQLETTLTEQVRQEALARLDAEIATLTAGTEAYDNAMKQRARIEAEFGKRARDETNKTADQMRDSWAPVLNGFEQVATGIISRNASLGQLLLQAADMVAQDLLRIKLRELEDVIFHEQAKTAVTGAQVSTREALSMTEGDSLIGRLGTMLAGWLGFETAKTATSTAGAAARTTAIAAETAAVIAATKIKAVAEIPAYTGVAAMGAASAVAPIPIIGPVLAAAAFAKMQALGGIALGMASFDVGTNYVPSNMIAQVHKGERIIPEADNRALMDAVGRGGPGRDGAVHLHIHPTRSNIVIDGTSVRRWFQGNSRNVAEAARTAMAKLQT